MEIKNLGYQTILCPGCYFILNDSLGLNKNNYKCKCGYKGPIGEINTEKKVKSLKELLEELKLENKTLEEELFDLG